MGGGEEAARPAASSRLSWPTTATADVIVHVWGGVGSEEDDTLVHVRRIWGDHRGVSDEQSPDLRGRQRVHPKPERVLLAARLKRGFTTTDERSTKAAPIILSVVGAGYRRGP